MEGDCKPTSPLNDATVLNVSKRAISLRILEVLKATKRMIFSSKSGSDASTNRTDSSNQRRQVHRRRGSRTEVARASAQECEASSARMVSARVEGLMKARSEHANVLEFEIEASKVHWSEVADSTSGDGEDENGESDEEVFARLQKKYGGFFQEMDWLDMGKKIAEGGQAEIFEQGRTTLKVMKEGYRLCDLEKQWPLGMFHNLDLLNVYNNKNCCLILGASLSKNGRFAFKMMKYWGNL